METGDDKKAENEGMKLLSAFGLAYNCVEIWSLYSNEQSREGLKFQASKMRKIVCNVRCITYSLSLFGWKYNYTGTNSGRMRNELDLQLAVAAGTVTNQILIWSALDENDCTGLVKDLHPSSGKESVQFQSKTVCHTLSGHEGVIYSCKFGGDGEFIASTSDDRTVRLWRRNRKSVSCGKSSASNEESPVLVTNIVDSDSNYELSWTGFGHTCRVFDCDFVRLQQSQTIGVVTSGEDGEIF
jgi:WD40 repeat protein